MAIRLTQAPRPTRSVLALLALFALGGCGSAPTRDSSDRLVPDPRSRQPTEIAMARASGPGASLTGDYASYPAAEQFIDRMVAKHGFDRDAVARSLSRAERQQWIVDLVNRPTSSKAAGPTGAWTRYREKFLTEANIANGAAFWARNASTLRRAETQYGVPPEAIVGILGVETRWGGYMGKTRVMDALVTLAFDFPRRSAYFTDELEAYLVMSRDEGVDPFHPVGSYAGAMGLGQFMPSSFQKYAVDFDGDGRRNLWDTEDAIGSVANYFAAHGWRRGEPVAVRARSSGGEGTLLKTGFDTRYSPSTLRTKGVSPIGSVPAAGEVSLLRLDAAGGYEYWLGFQNFYVITRYNHSTHYAMAVYQLGQAVRARRGGTMAARDGGGRAVPATGTAGAAAVPGAALAAPPYGARLSLR